MLWQLWTIQTSLSSVDILRRPGAEELHPDWLSVIQEIDSAGAAAHGRRRSEQLSAVKTLNDLREALLKLGYNLSRSAAIYLRLQPRRADSVQAKKHIKMVPVKLKRA